MKKELISIFAIIIFILSRCSTTAQNQDSIAINRFDISLYNLIISDNNDSLQKIKQQYPQMINVLEKALFKNSNNNSDTINFDRIINYFAEPTLKNMYNYAINTFSPDSAITKAIQAEIVNNYSAMKNIFNDIQIPAIYFHVSGLQQNIIVADSLISCSIDKYLGSDYELYQDFFYDYQSRAMIPERIAPDLLNAWLKSEFSFKGDEKLLLERLVYEGKIVSLMFEINKNYDFQKIFSLTDEEFDWLKKNEKTLWTYIIENNHLYNLDGVTTSKYFSQIPAHFISQEAPAFIGNFIGYQIVSKYKKNTKQTSLELMQNNDAQSILTKSKYKP